jgi:hypothetical protein
MDIRGFFGGGRWKVYGIVSYRTTPPSIYVGHTELDLRHRHAMHVIDYYNWKKGKNLRPACRSRDVLEDPSAKIELLEGGIQTREQVQWRERHWYDQKKRDGFNVTNRCRPRISEDEARETKRESERRNPKTEAQKQRKREMDKLRHQSEEFKQQNRERSDRLRQDPEFRAKRNQYAKEYRSKIRGITS